MKRRNIALTTDTHTYKRFRLIFFLWSGLSGAASLLRGKKKSELDGDESKPEPGPSRRAPGMSYLTIAIVMILVSTIFLLVTRNILQIWSRGLILSGLTIGIIYGFITLVKGHVGAATSVLLLAVAAVFSCFMMTDTGGNLTQPFFRTVLGVQLVPLGLELGGRSMSGLALTGVGLGFLVPDFTVPYGWLAVAVSLILIGILCRKGVFMRVG